MSKSFCTAASAVGRSFGSQAQQLFESCHKFVSNARFSSSSSALLSSKLLPRVKLMLKEHTLSVRVTRVTAWSISR